MVSRATQLTSHLSLIEVVPPISGYDKFIGCYVIHGKQKALVDTGPSSSIGDLLSGLHDLRIAPSEIDYIFLTHVHIDHAGGTGDILKSMPNARVVIQARGVPHMIDPVKLWEGSLQTLGEQAVKYGPIKAVPRENIIVPVDRQVFDLGGIELQVLDTPGHATHHQSFWSEKERLLFAGEAAGMYFGEADLIRPVAPPPFNLEHALQSLDRLLALKPSAICFGHFGYATGAVEKMTFARQQLVLWAHVISEMFEKNAGPQEIFERIKREDKMLSRIDRLPPARRDREIFFLNNGIKGFAGYFNKYGTEFARNLKNTL